MRIINDEQDMFLKIKRFEKNRLQSTPAHEAFKMAEINKAIYNLVEKNGSMLDCLKTLSTVMKEIRLKAQALVLDGDRRLEAVEVALQRGEVEGTYYFSS